MDTRKGDIHVSPRDKFYNCFVLLLLGHTYVLQLFQHKGFMLSSCKAVQDSVLHVSDTKSFVIIENFLNFWSANVVIPSVLDSDLQF